MSEIAEIKPIVANESELKQLAQDYGNLLVTPQNLDAADKARLRLKNERLAIQKQEKANNDVLKRIKKDNEDRAELLIRIIKPVEERLERAVSDIKAEAERLRKEAEKKEIDRIHGHRTRITGIAQETARLALVQDIELIISKQTEIDSYKGTFEEFEQEGSEAIQLFNLSAENRIKQLVAEAKPVEEKLPETPVKADLQWKGGKVFAEEKSDGYFTIVRPKDAVTIDVSRINNMTPEEVIKTYGQTGEMVFVPSNEVLINYSVMGYDFHIPTNIPEEYRNKITSQIESILGDMPL